MTIPKKLNKGIISDILKHAEEGHPKEICGVVILDSKNKQKYIRCLNIAENPTEEFKMCPHSYMEAEEQGEIVGIVHSHPDGSSQPSPYDIAVMTINREIQTSIDQASVAIPWHIVSYPDGDYRQVIPSDSTSLLGRQFVHGLWDCWSTCESYYKKYHNITFQPFERKDLWWEDKEAKSLYEDFYEGAGFYQVDTPEVGDMIIMQIGRSYHPNHAGIYLGNMKEFEGNTYHGSTLMLHHMYGKKSEVIVYGGQWSQRTRLILRHKDVK